VGLSPTRQHTLFAREVIHLEIVLPHRWPASSVCHRSPFESIGISMSDNKRPFNFIDRKIHHHKISNRVTMASRLSPVVAFRIGFKGAFLES
jgi:hypothetical protein